MIPTMTDRIGALASNALQVLLHGGFETDEVCSPYEVVAQAAMYRLRRYFPDAEPGRPAVILVPPMMFVADVYDVSSSSSAVSVLHENGIDPWVVDFGAPEHEEGGLQRTLSDHILAVSEIVDLVRAETGREVHLGGYSQGGVFSYAVAAYRRGEGLASVITFGSPVDTKSVGIFSLPDAVMELAADRAASGLARTGLPGWATREGFRMLAPVKNLKSRARFLLQLHDREALLPHERQRRFIESEGWIAWPAPALSEALRQFIAQNRLLSGGLVVNGRTLSLADLDRPVLVFVGEGDKIGQPQAVRAIGRAAPRAQISEMALPVGHLGIVVGGAATTGTWPAVAAWALHHDAGTALPAGITALTTATAEASRGPVLSLAGRGLHAGVTLTAQTIDATRALRACITTSVPRLLRLQSVHPESLVSLGRLLDERAERRPDEIGFLWQDRAYTHAAFKGRVDAVVAGLISAGVRHGDRVGVLMDMRPSMVVTVAAINRIGAVAVLLRPHGSVARELALSPVSRIVTDPEHVIDLRAQTDTDVLVLGGGARLRDLGVEGVLDLERVVPEDVSMPDWYRPNPGLGRELAFVLFDGEGEATTARGVTHARFARAAWATATSAALTSRDSVYSVTPIHHPAGLLMSLGGAVAGRARFAMASGFEPETFWEEARRYGVTVVSYTWPLLRDLVQASPNEHENHHLIRAFVGTGMPAGLWRDVEERFAPARVIEYFAPSRSDAILVNLRSDKPGSQGAPLPGGPELRVARADQRTGDLVIDAAGLAERCRVREIGLLLSRVESGMRPSGESLRGLFAPGDHWESTGAYGHVDEDGDYWMLPSAGVATLTGS